MAERFSVEGEFHVPDERLTKVTGRGTKYVGLPRSPRGGKAQAARTSYVACAA